MTGKDLHLHSPIVMRGHSRSKNGVASLAYDPRIHAFLSVQQDVNGRVIRAFTPVFDGLCPAMTHRR
jgi:hypothetical protein